MNGTILFFIGLMSGIFIDFILASQFKKRKKFKLRGFRIHHTIFALFFIALSFFIYTPFLLGLGIGIIFWHTIRNKKLTFVERNAKNNQSSSTGSMQFF